MRTSYEKNNYGNILNALILVQQPYIVVECGVLDGYSASYIAEALKFNRHRNGTKSYFFAYDLFEDYEYKHGSYEEVENFFKLQKLDIVLYQWDAFEAIDHYDDFTIDFLHMDISNDGDILIKTLDMWGDKIHPCGMIAFEGGSKERDEGWIKKYNKRPIRPVLKEINEWDYKVYNEFPGLILLWKKQ